MASVKLIAPFGMLLRPYLLVCTVNRHVGPNFKVMDVTMENLAVASGPLIFDTDLILLSAPVYVVENKQRSTKHNWNELDESVSAVLILSLPCE